MLSGHREVLPQPVQQRETLGGEAGPPERRGWMREQRLNSFSWKLLIECSLSHQFVERDSILGQGAYLIGLIT